MTGAKGFAPSHDYKVNINMSRPVTFLSTPRWNLLRFRSKCPLRLEDELMTFCWSKVRSRCDHMVFSFQYDLSKSPRVKPRVPPCCFSAESCDDRHLFTSPSQNNEPVILADAAAAGGLTSCFLSPLVLSSLQVCATYMDGFRATAVCPVGGPRAAEKARRTADSIIKR